MWQVSRHGGRHLDEWRVVLKTADEGKARTRFTKVKEALRQGAVSLTDATGEMIAHAFAPRLRTRW